MCMYLWVCVHVCVCVLCAYVGGILMMHGKCKKPEFPMKLTKVYSCVLFCKSVTSTPDNLQHSHTPLSSTLAHPSTLNTPTLFYLQHSHTPLSSTVAHPSTLNIPIPLYLQQSYTPLSSTLPRPPLPTLQHTSISNTPTPLYL